MNAEKSGRAGHYNIDLDAKRSYGPTFEYLEFPLFVGKTWRYQFDGTSTGSTPFTYLNRYKVLKVEDRRVAAETFKAFKIRVNHQIVAGPGGVKYVWYAPDAKRIILTKPSWRKGEELLQMDLAKEALSVQAHCENPRAIVKCGLPGGRSGYMPCNACIDAWGEVIEETTTKPDSSSRTKTLDVSACPDIGAVRRCRLPAGDEVHMRCNSCVAAGGTLLEDTRIASQQVTANLGSDEESKPVARRLTLTSMVDALGVPVDYLTEFKTVRGPVKLVMELDRLVPSRDYLLAIDYVDEHGGRQSVAGWTIRSFNPTKTIVSRQYLPSRPGRWRVEVKLDLETVGSTEFSVVEE